jgi:hypothetical protein
VCPQGMADGILWADADLTCAEVWWWDSQHGTAVLGCSIVLPIQQPALMAAEWWLCRVAEWRAGRFTVGDDRAR